MKNLDLFRVSVRFLIIVWIKDCICIYENLEGIQEGVLIKIGKLNLKNLDFYCVSYLTVDIPFSNSLPVSKSAHCQAVYGYFSSIVRTDLTSMLFIGKRTLKTRPFSGRTTVSWRQGTCSRWGAASELPFQFSGSAQNKWPDLDHWLFISFDDFLGSINFCISN